MSSFILVVTYILLFISLFLEVYFLISFFEDWTKKESKEKKGVDYTRPENLPSATIIVPCWNEETTVKGTIDSLLNLNYPKEKLDIFIIDDGSTDGTWNIIQTYNSHPQITLFQKENGGKHTAVNLGLEHVKSDLVGLLDADSFVHTEALMRIVDTFLKEPETKAVTPAMTIHNANTLARVLQRTEYFFAIFMRKTSAAMGALYVIPGPFSFIRTEVFKSLGEYKHAYLTEDMEYAMRMQSHHYTIANRHDAYVYTVGPADPKGLFKQRLRWIYGFLNNARDYKHLFFTPRYGDLSLLMLPSAVVFLIGSFVLFSTLISSTSTSLAKGISRIRTVGVDVPASLTSPDWFFFNTDALLFLSVFVMILTIVLILIGKKLAGEKMRFSPDIVLFLLIYGIVALSWNTVALYKTLASRKVSWR
ncbi:MAG: glycosyltransferase family 2 protein [Parcubacteria group bacterium]|nr:glycosyltransferase family 2 protein [Parcubacteria group bacterium]